MTSNDTDDIITALMPRAEGHQFTVYGDSCSGIAGHLHEANLARINAVVARLSPSPEFILYPGDEIIGLTGSEADLRAQWRHWWDVEMALPRERAIPIYNCTGNHTTYNALSESVYRDALAHLPQNGPASQRGLSYFVRRDDLLLVFVNTLCADLGGEGHVETAWLEQVLTKHGDARWRFVIGHHPVFPVNGYYGDYQRTVGSEYRDRFWGLLLEHGVFAYICSHILAFDVQVHDGILQITTAGAGTAHRMPEDIEYLHCVQAAIDGEGLRYQVLDDAGRQRERLTWPPHLASADRWVALAAGSNRLESVSRDAIRAWRFAGELPTGGPAGRQTLLAMSAAAELETLWIGLSGAEHRLTVMMRPQPGQSPHYWFGPALGADGTFDVQLALHPDMGPGGVLWRNDERSPWHSCKGASAWGAERLDWCDQCIVGRGVGGSEDAVFEGSLTVRALTSPAV